MNEFVKNETFFAVFFFNLNSVARRICLYCAIKLVCLLFLIATFACMKMSFEPDGRAPRAKSSSNTELSYVSQSSALDPLDAIAALRAPHSEAEATAV